MSLDVRLINMPFGRVSAPSIALTQLRARAEETLGNRVSVSIHDVNHDVASAMGIAVYDLVALGIPSLNTGFGDWLYRTIAFPTLEDNSTEYLRRFGRMLPAALVEQVRGQGACSSRRLAETLRKVIRRYSLDQADVVGFTSMFAQTIPSLAMARLLREENPDTILIMGGANCEGSMGAALANQASELDFILSGPSLVSFPKFLVHLAAGDLDKCEEVPGVIACSRRRAAGGPAALPRMGQDLDINTPIALDYDSFVSSFESIPGPKRPIAIQFETSRGCWWGERAHCTFCGLNGGSMGYRATSPDAARRLISDLVTRYHGKALRYECVDNIMPKEYVSGVFAHLDVPEDVEIFYETKADLTDAEVAILGRGGVRRIQPGIESLLTSTLKLMRKGTTAFQNIKLLKSCLKHDVIPSWNLLLGFPGEDPEGFRRYLEIVPLLHHLAPPIGAITVRFDRYSPYHSAPEQFGLSLRPADFYRYLYPFNDAFIEDFAYYFMNVDDNATYIQPLMEGLGPVVAAVEAWKSLWQDGSRVLPRLERHEVDGRPAILDSRFGAQAVHELTDNEDELLHALVEPTEISWAASNYGAALERLRELRLVFEERGRVISVAMGFDRASPAEASALEFAAAR